MGSRNDSFKKDIINSSFGNLFFQIIILLARIIQVPILLKFYGVNNYGGIILIISITSYLTLFEFGFKNYSINKSIKLYYEKRIDEFEKIFFQTIRFLIRSSFFLILILFFLTFIIYSLTNFSNKENWLTSVFILSICILLTNIMSFISDFYRIINRQIKTFFFDSLTIFVPIIIVIIYIYFKKEFKDFDIVIYSILNLFSILVVLTFLIANQKKHININKYIFGKIELPYILKNLKKSIFFTLFTANTIIVTHSITQIIAIYLDTNDIAIYNTTKMITNLIIFFFGSVSISFLADITRRNDNKKLINELSSIVKLYHYLIFIFLFLSSIFFNLFGEYIYKVWLKNIDIIFNKELLKLLLISTILTVYNTSNSNILISTNNHVKFSIINIFPTGIYILTSFYFINKYSLIGAVYAVIIFEIINLVIINYLIFDKLKNIKILFIKHLLIFLFLLSLYLINHIYLLVIIVFFMIFSFKYIKEIYLN